MGTTWDPNNKGAGITLSGGNLVATCTSGTTGVQANYKISGPVYFELTVGSSLTGIMAIGVAVQSGFAGQAGSDASAVGYYQDGTVKINGSTLSTIATYAATNVISVAFNAKVQKIWFRVNGGNWNNDVIANQNPVGSVGGISTSTLNASGTFCPCWSSSTVTPNQSVTANFSGSFTYTAPTGFITIDTIQSGGVIGNKDRRSNFSVSAHNQKASLFGARARMNSAPMGNFFPVPVGGTLPVGTVGLPYSYSIAITGGQAPYTTQIISGSLPPGMSLNGSANTLTATSLTTPGNYSFTLQVTDSRNIKGSEPFGISVVTFSNYAFAS